MSKQVSGISDDNITKIPHHARGKSLYAVVRITKKVRIVEINATGNANPVAAVRSSLRNTYSIDPPTNGILSKTFFNSLLVDLSGSFLTYGMQWIV
jgi:hypothetical protein